MDTKLYSDLKILTAQLHEALIALCEKHPEKVDEINFYVTKETILNNFLYSTNERVGFRNLLEAQRIAQNEFNELRDMQ